MSLYILAIILPLALVAVYFLLCWKIQRLERSNLRLWDHIRHIGKQQRFVNERLYALEKIVKPGSIPNEHIRFLKNALDGKIRPDWLKRQAD